MSLYIISRLVRRGFTLGELSLATGSGISLALEFWRLTLTRVCRMKRLEFDRSDCVIYSSPLPSEAVYRPLSACRHRWYHINTS